MSYMPTIAEQDAEALWADGWRVEPTILGGARVTKEYGNVYATVTPATGDRGGFYWAVWYRFGGEFLTGAWSGGAKLAASNAWKAMQKHR